MAGIQLYGIPNCDTVKRARAWLQAQGADHVFVDFKKQPPQSAALQRWADAAGLDALLNRRGSTWRALDDAARLSAASVTGALALMRAQPSLVKRPVVEWADGAVTVGFDAADWARRLG
jgi:arsenate reductase (glutaredoxin)